MKKQIIAVLALACVGLSACGNTAESAEPKTTSAAETTTTTTAETTAETTTTEPTTTTAETTTTQATTTETPEPESDMMFSGENCLNKLVKDGYDKEVSEIEFSFRYQHKGMFGVSPSKEGLKRIVTRDDKINNISIIAVCKEENETYSIKISGARIYEKLTSNDKLNIKCFAKYDSIRVFEGDDIEIHEIYYNPFAIDEQKEYTVDEWKKKIEKYYEENFGVKIDTDNITLTKKEKESKTSDDISFELRPDDIINSDYMFVMDNGDCIYAPDAEYFCQ